MEITKIVMDELPGVVDLYKNAILKMQGNNIFQWDELYPNENDIQDDIAKGQLHGIKIGREIVSVFVINQESDKDYLNGKWQYNQAQYRVLHRICVNPDYQNRGIGTKTMMHIEDYLKNEKVESLRLDAFSKNPIALRMYQKLGYKKVGEANWRKGLFYLLEKIF